MNIKHIGIVAVSAPGAAICYQAIVNESEKHLGTRSNPQITLTHPPFDAIYQAQVNRDWQRVAVILTDAVKNVAAAGADFAVIPANSVHFAIDEIQKRSPIPVLNLLDIVANECKRRGYTHPLILGVGITMDDHLYDEALRKQEILTVYPNDAEKKRINEIIYTELVKGVCEPKSTKEIVHIIKTSKANGTDTVILACTELPLVLNDANAPLPTIDTTRLLARAAVQLALASLRLHFV